MSSQLVGLPVTFSSNEGTVFGDVTCLTLFSHASMLLDLVSAEGVEDLTHGTVKCPVFKFIWETETPGKLVTRISWGWT